MAFSIHQQQKVHMMSFANRQYPVNKGKFGNLKTIDSIGKKLSALLDQACEQNDKTMPVRFDLHYPQDQEAPGDNKDISRTMAKLSQKYKRGDTSPEYAWVREQKKNRNPHYHCVLLVDAERVNTPKQVFQDAEQLWGSTIGANRKGLLNDCFQGKNREPHENGIIIDKHAPDGRKNFEKARHQISYLEKAADKGPTKDGLRNFGTSRIDKKNGGSI